MKIPFDRSVVIISLCVLSIIASAGYALTQNMALQEATLQNAATIQSSERLSLLKTRWGKSAEIERKSAFLLAHPALVAQERRQKTLFLEYNNLSEGEFDRIVSTLMNAPFVITHLKLSRATQAGTISVEIEQ